MREVLIFWAKTFHPGTEEEANQIVEIRSSLKDLIPIFHIVQDDCEEAF